MSVHVSQPVKPVTNGSGAATEYSETIEGRLLAVIYTKVDFADGVDFTITDEITGADLYTASDQNSAAVKYPRLLAQGGTGSNLTGWYVEPPVAARIKVVIAQGGSGKTGEFRFVYER